MSASSATRSRAPYVDALAGAFAAAGRATGVCERDLLVGGLRIRVATAGSAARELVAALPLEAAARDIEPDGTAHVWDDATTGGRLPEFPWTPAEVGRQGAIVGWNDDELRTVYHGNVMEPPLYDFNAFSLFDRRSASTYFWFARPACVPWFEHVEPLRPSLHWLLSHRERHLVHAAAVGTPDGAVLMAGAGFAGKTTTAMACVESGLDFLGDNYVVLTLADGNPAVHSLYPNIKLRRDSLGLVPDVRESALTAVGDRAVFDVAGSRPAQFARSRPIRAVVVVRHGVPETRIAPAPASAALVALAPSTIYQLPANGGTGLRPLAELVRRVPSYVLDVGPDPHTAAPVIAELVERA